LGFRPLLIFKAEFICDTTGETELSNNIQTESVIEEEFMKARLFVLVSLLVLLIAGCGVQQIPQDLESLKVTVRLATLTGSATYPTANGKATYKVDNNGIREFQAELEDALTLRGKVLSIYVGAAKVGTMRMNALGDGRLELVGAAAPVIRVSSTPTIRVRTAAGALVASGIMNQIK
jgi:hypothetical protein